MKITLMSWFDQAGGTGRLGAAIREIGHEARALSWAQKVWPWPCIRMPTIQETLEAIDWADALIIISVRYPAANCQQLRWDLMFPAGVPDKPTVVNYRGSLYLDNIDFFNRVDAKDGVVQSGNFCDLLASGGIEHWLPNPLWCDEIATYRQREPDGVFRVMQSVIVSERLILKNGPQVSAALQDLPGVEYFGLSELPYQDAMRYVGKHADLVATAFDIGFGNAGIEAMAMGIPVLANGPDAYIDIVLEKVGYLPFVQCPLEDVRRIVELLHHDADMYEQYSQLGRQYVRQFHDPQLVAHKAIELCKLAGAA